MSKTPNESGSSGRIAGIDFGTVRIGIAITDPQQKIASPHDLYHRKGTDQDAQYFRNLAMSEHITLWVVGLPIHLSGSESQKSREARAFGAWLEATTGISATYYDERFTTLFADELLMEGTLSDKQRKRRRDKIAAQILLASFLESDRSMTDTALPLEDSPERDA
tara:strand:- start:483 stop:977 length:495 start_codon:yes stop_codon:yes gene_type:complete